MLESLVRAALLDEFLILVSKFGPYFVEGGEEPTTRGK